MLGAVTPEGQALNAQIQAELARAERERLGVVTKSAGRTSGDAGLHPRHPVTGEVTEAERGPDAEDEDLEPDEDEGGEPVADVARADVGKDMDFDSQVLAHLEDVAEALHEAKRDQYMDMLGQCGEDQEGDGGDEDQDQDAEKAARLPGHASDSAGYSPPPASPFARNLGGKHTSASVGGVHVEHVDLQALAPTQLASLRTAGPPGPSSLAGNPGAVAVQRLDQSGAASPGPSRSASGQFRATPSGSPAARPGFHQIPTGRQVGTRASGTVGEPPPGSAP